MFCLEIPVSLMLLQACGQVTPWLFLDTLGKEASCFKVNAALFAEEGQSCIWASIEHKTCTNLPAFCVKKF